jgi:Holliday junction DNA helicase RuvA
MIAFLKGVFAHKSPALVYMDVQGVGYEVQISLNTYSQIHHLEQGRLYTHLHIREDAHVLFGFYELAEKELFLSLIAISGVGAATARMMLSSMKPDELRSAIVQGDTAALERIKGIGKKSAERIVLELRDKLGKGATTPHILAPAGNTQQQDALQALISLGIARAQAETAIQKVLKSETEQPDIETIIKKALKIV